MGSPSLAFKFLITFPFLMLIFQSHCTANGLDYDQVDYESSKAVSEKVNLSVYYEPLNRSCASFIVKNLALIFDNGLNNIVNLRLIPLVTISHVNQSSNSTICLNGTDHCQFNTLQACTINVLQDVNKHYALIYCFEFLVIERRHKEWHTCFSSLGLPPKPVLDCLNSINGTKFVQDYASETAQLNPPHAFVPWVVVNNNQSIGIDYRNFTFYACKSYKGTSLPMACQIP